MILPELSETWATVFCFAIVAVVIVLCVIITSWSDKHDPKC